MTKFETCRQDAAVRHVQREAQRIAILSSARMAREAAAAATQAAARAEDTRYRLSVALVDMTKARWKRPCFICSSLLHCDHREPELIDRWMEGNRA